MRVLQVTNSLSATVSSGGVEVVVRNAHKALKLANVDSKVCAMSLKGDTPEEFKQQDFNITNTPKLIPSKSWSRFSLIAARNLFRQVKLSDVVHIHLCKDFFTVFAAFVCKIKNKPFVIQTHGMINYKGKVTGQISISILKVLISKAKIFCLTILEREQLEYLGFKGQKVIVPNPIYVEEFEAYNSDQRICDIIFMSRFHTRKRPEMVVEATHILKQSGRNVQVLMAGPDDGKLQDTISLIKFYGLEESISIPGPVARSKIKHTLKTAKIFVLPSYGEIYPMAALEAASTSTPMILGSDCPLALELFDFGAALLADTPQELALQIERLLNDNLLLNRIIQNAHDWIQKNCSYDIYTSQVIPIYQSLLKEYID